MIHTTLLPTVPAAATATAKEGEGEEEEDNNILNSVGDNCHSKMELHLLIILAVSQSQSCSVHSRWTRGTDRSSYL